MTSRQIQVLRRAENDARILEVVERHGSPERVERLKGQAGGNEHEFLLSEQIRALAEIIDGSIEGAAAPKKKAKKQ